MSLYVVATPIGNTLDISKRSIEILKKVDFILCEDTRNSSNLFKILNIENKLISYHKFNEEKKSIEIIKLLKDGKNIALVTDAGTPCISDPGSVVVNLAISNNIDVFSIPGPSALITALTLTGLKIDNFAFYGFLERHKGNQKKQLEIINNNDVKIVIFYESPKRIIDTIMNIKDVMTDPYIVLLNELTKKFEKKYYGNCTTVLEKLNNNKNSQLGEYVIIVLKNKKENIIIDKISAEAILVDTIIKNKCSIKEAIKLASINNKLYSKNEYYNASINLKSIW